MKRKAFAFLLMGLVALCAFTSCSNDDNDNKEESGKTLTGKTTFAFALTDDMFNAVSVQIQLTDKNEKTTKIDVDKNKLIDEKDLPQYFSNYTKDIDEIINNFGNDVNVKFFVYDIDNVKTPEKYTVKVAITPLENITVSEANFIYSIPGMAFTANGAKTTTTQSRSSVLLNKGISTSSTTLQAFVEKYNKHSNIYTINSDGSLKQETGN